MKNIYKVFISDWKRISKNVVAVVVGTHMEKSQLQE